VSLPKFSSTSDLSGKRWDRYRQTIALSDDFIKAIGMD